MPKTYKIEVSSRTIVFTVFFLIFLKFLWIVKDLAFSLLIAFIIMSAVRPAVLYLEKKRIPRHLSTILIFSFFLSLIGYAFFVLVPPIAEETTGFIKNLPLIIERLNTPAAKLFNVNSLSQYFPNFTNQIINVIGAVFSNAIFIFSTLFFSIYFIVDENFLRKLLIRFFEDEKAERITNIFNSIEKRMNAWFWGELTLMLVIGVMTFVGLNLIGLKYALPLAIIAGLLEAVPNLGPITSMIPALIIALTESYFLVLPTVALYFIVQQLENNLIVPMVMKKAVGLNPIITLIALIIGGKIGGVLGILLAIPTTLFIETILVEMMGRVDKQ